jgi:hypothetical protein
MAQARDRIRELANGQRSEAKSRFENRLASIRAIRRPATVRTALSGKMRANFFLGANPVFPKPHLRGGRASGTLSRSNAGALLSKRRIPETPI